MNKIFKLCSLLIAVVISSCSQSGVEVGSDSDLYGKVSLALDTDGEFSVVESSSSTKASTKASSVSVDNFTVSIYRSSGDLYHAYEKYSDLASVSQLPVGIYGIFVESSTLEGVAFDSPYYYGEDTSVSIKENELTEVEIVCALSNSKITFSVSDEFKAQYRDYYFVVSNESGSVEVSPTETRSIYIDPSMSYTITIYAWDYNSVDGDDPTIFTYSDLSADAQTHYQMSVTTSAIGTGSVTVVIDPTVIEQNFEIVVPGEEDLGDNEAPIWPSESQDEGTTDTETEVDPELEPEPEVELPSITGEGFDITSELTITDADIAAGSATVAATVAAPNGGIANLYATLDSPDIGDSIIDALFDGSYTFDLANLVEGSQTKSMLLSVGLITEDTVIKGQSDYLFDVSAFMSLLTVGGNGSQTHKFHIRVVDASGAESSQTLTVVRTN